MSLGKNIRSFARTWFDQHVESPNGKMFSSKFFFPDESWTGDKAWWLRIRLDYAESMAEKDQYFYLLCQKEEDTDSFYCLRVPAKFLHQRSDSFRKAVLSQRGEQSYNLMLSACAESLFIDYKSKLDFSEFLVEPSLRGQS